MRLSGVVTAMIVCANLLAGNPDSVKIRDQAAAYFAAEAADAEAKRALETQQPDGSWKDINYADKGRGSWAPRTHFDRARLLAAAYRREGSALFDKPEARDAAIRALEYWAQHDFTSPNWWHQSIGTPMGLCEAIILLGDECSSPLREKLRPILDRSQPGMTAQNRVWLAGVELLKGAIYDKPEWIGEGAAAIAEELRVAAPGGEGIQPDWSFHQHGPQLQFGNYGLAFFAEMTKWGTILHGTRYEFAPEKISILNSYYNNGIRWVLFLHEMDFSACGRQISPGQPEKKYRAAVNTINRLNRTLGIPGKVTEKELRFSGSRYFPDSDFYVQRNGAECYWSVKMTSSRTVPSETVNSENLLGRLTGHGATVFVSDRNELTDIGGVWDWRKIPGVTSVQDDSLLLCKDPGLRNRLDWVGGVSDGEIGFCAMDFDNGEVAAKKSCFFFGPEMIAVGSGIRSDSAAHVVTTAAQYRSDETVRSIGNISLTGSGNFAVRLLNGICTDIAVDSSEKTGDWKRVTDALSDKPVKARLFTYTFDHGVKPKDGSYAYQVIYLPQKDACTGKLLPTGSKHIHAVAGKDAVMAAFYEPGVVTLPDGGTLEAKQPALVMLRNHRIYAADPGRKWKTLDVVLSGKPYRISFPEGSAAGDTVSIPF